MPHSNDLRDVEQLKRETERSREQLAQTVHRIRDVVGDATADLGDRIAPDTIKANIGDFVRTRGENILEAARKNPMQAAAVGAMAAYPALALARRIPAPVMMIGAGLFLMNSGTGRNFSQKATEGASDLADRGRRMANDWRDKSAETLASVADQASSVGASIRDSVSEKADDARRYAAGIGDYTSDQSRDLSGDARESLQRSADALTDWARENPILAAAIGVAVGGLVSSALPVTRAEAQLAETAGGDLRRRLGDAVGQGVTAATGIADQIVAGTSQQGLTPQAAADASRDFGDRALKVAGAAADAALSRGDQQEDRQTPAGE